MQDFPDDYIELLQNSDLTNDNDRTMCIQAATLLTQALSVQLQPGKNEFFLFSFIDKFFPRNGKNVRNQTKTRITRTNSKTIFLTM